MSRRDALKAIAAVGAATATGYVWWSRERPKQEWFVEPYIAACEDESKRLGFFRMLRRSLPYYIREISYTPSNAVGSSYDPHHFATTVPLMEDIVGMGSFSKIFIYPVFFGTPTRTGAILATQSIVNHERVHADHFAQGITGVQRKRFERGDRFDMQLFSDVSDIVAHHVLYNALRQYDDDDRGIHDALLAETAASRHYIGLVRERTDDPQILAVAGKYALAKPL